MNNPLMANRSRNSYLKQNGAIENQDGSNATPLVRCIEKIHGRLNRLYQLTKSSTLSSSDLLPSVLMELGIISETLQLATQEMIHQEEMHASIQTQVEAERKRYKSLLELIPDGYLVTDANYVIQEVNRAAIHLLKVEPQALIGKPLSQLVRSDDRCLFQAKLSQLIKRKQIEFSVSLQRNYTDFFNASLIASHEQDQGIDPPTIRWLMRDITERKRAEGALKSPNYDICQDRVFHSFSKGEVIPLEPQEIWVVAQGAVKLSTMSDRGEEMLIGLIRDSMIFGPSLTTLQTYQAIAMTKVRLVSIALTEVIHSPRLAQALLPLISQRLRQTESFLAIYGQLHVEDRLNHLLALLKREMGHPNDNGVRLSIRLTHQDFANACCTTRVTITRLLGKLQQKGRIAFDAQSHLILKE
ncbi:PAS domain S-box protein (plasmid) [Kovacikia minuta CCNUW1]|uniref:PAS domain S-box protein n=1 Tax=Kovacikia minuta TaxID=2931930 RepID=UPI001CCB9A7C|nr:PAS domain S-box protein [Kovacikia minuta]UBF30585.1 PAS domain S-box protein [Kovacikia minuta CCNUW1]